MLLHTHSLWGAFGETRERDVAHTLSGQRQHFTMPNLAHVLAPHHKTHKSAATRFPSLPFPLPMPDRETDTRSNYTRTILANGICANMDRLAPDKARARVAGVIHSVVGRRDTTRKQQTPRSAAADRSRWPGQADVKH